MSTVSQEQYLTAIADAIRSKEGTTDDIPAYTFPARVASLSQGVQLTADDIASYTITEDDLNAMSPDEVQDEMLLLLASAIRAKEGSTGSIVATEFASRILSIDDEQSSPSHNLPDGYTELEYIESTGTQTIKTSVTAAPNYTYKADIEPTSLSTSYSYFFGAMVSSSYIKVSFQGRSDKGFSVATVANNNVIISTDVSLRRMLVILSIPDKYAEIDGVKTTLSPQSYTMSGNNMYIFSIAGNTSGMSSAKLYSFQIFNTSKDLVYDFVPAKNSSGTVGLYEIINGKFYTNSGTGSFVSGPEI